MSVRIYYIGIIILVSVYACLYRVSDLLNTGLFALFNNFYLYMCHKLKMYLRRKFFKDQIKELYKSTETFVINVLGN